MKFRLLMAVLAVPVAAACISYSPQEVTAMSDYRLCELEIVYRSGLSGEAGRRLRAELQRRNESCKDHIPAIRAQLKADLEQATYGNQSP